VLLQLLQALFAEAFTLWGAPVTRLELIAFALALAMVGCNIRVNPWGWPLAMLSSLLYFGLFWRSLLYGEASLQIFFILIAAWGWWQWLYGKAADGTTLRVRRLSTRGRWMALIALAVAWPATGAFLAGATDTDVPWWDAFPTAASVIGQWLLARKYVENWPTWIVVNVVSVALFAYKGLWLTAGLYAIFIGLSAIGWRAWNRLAADAKRP
jgi:nicotinamide mononucleotide transporter